MNDTYWNYRIWRIHLDDGVVYGMKETFYQDVNGQQFIQFWDAEPHWIEQDANDFLRTIDRYEQEVKRGEYPEWSIGYTPEETLIALKNMRQAVEQKILDEAEVMREMGE